MSTSLLAACRGPTWLCALLVLAGCASHRGSGSGEQFDPAQFPRFELAPEVRRTLESGGPDAHMAMNYLKYGHALVGPPGALDAIVAPDVKLNDLEPLGFKGLAGLKEFRSRSNASATYDRAIITSIRFPSPDITDVDLCTERTDAASGAKRSTVIHARDRWVNDMVVERWHSVKGLPPGSSCPPSPVS